MRLLLARRTLVWRRRPFFELYPHESATVAHHTGTGGTTIWNKMGMPFVTTHMATELIDSSNCISLQTINVEELSLAQFQTLITVPFSEILVIDESAQLKSVPPAPSLIVSDLALAGDNQQLVDNNIVVYVPPELATIATSDESQLARQWYEDSLVATQAMSFLSQVMPLITENSIVDKPIDAQVTTG